jgi:hypothetical protein
MVLVGLIIPVLLRNKQKGYSRVNQEDHLDQANDMNMVNKYTTVIEKKKFLT